MRRAEGRVGSAQATCSMSDPAPPLPLPLPKTGRTAVRQGSCAEARWCLRCSQPRVPPTPPPCPCPANNKVLKKTRFEHECSLDAPFGTQFIRYPHPVPNSFGSNKTRSERKCSLDTAFVGHGGGGLGPRPAMANATATSSACVLAIDRQWPSPSGITQAFHEHFMSHGTRT